MSDKVVEPIEANVHLAAKAILLGKLVVFPTETVYGLGGNSLDESAIRSIFELKDRPYGNPLIVHLSGIDQAKSIVERWSSEADLLAKHFWPGPLSLILRKNDVISKLVGAGGDTIAIRMPNHPVALALIEACRVPLVAPSANKFMAVSPTNATDVSDEIANGVAYILDGGNCQIGIESTVIDLTREAPIILRLGGAERSEIEQILGQSLQVADASNSVTNSSPGSYLRHYAPKAKVVLVSKLNPNQAGLTLSEPQNSNQLQMPQIATGYGNKLYSSLIKLDSLGASEIAIEMPPISAEWEAVWDRLRKASHQVD